MIPDQTNSMRKFLRQGRLSRTIRLIFSEDILLNYNIDGNQKKKRLKDHEHLFRSLMSKFSARHPTFSDPFNNYPQLQTPSVRWNRRYPRKKSYSKP